jgi:hypothetical protein
MTLFILVVIAVLGPFVTGLLVYLYFIHKGEPHTTADNYAAYANGAGVLVFLAIDAYLMVYLLD